MLSGFETGSQTFTKTFLIPNPDIGYSPENCPQQLNAEIISTIHGWNTIEFNHNILHICLYQCLVLRQFRKQFCCLHYIQKNVLQYTDPLLNDTQFNTCHRNPRKMTKCTTLLVSSAANIRSSTKIIIIGA